MWYSSKELIKEIRDSEIRIALLTFRTWNDRWKCLAMHVYQQADVFHSLDPLKNSWRIFSALTSLFSIPSSICNSFQEVFLLGICLREYFISFFWRSHLCIFPRAETRFLPRAMGYVLRDQPIFLQFHLFCGLCHISLHINTRTLPAPRRNLNDQGYCWAMEIKRKTRPPCCMQAVN